MEEGSSTAEGVSIPMLYRERWSDKHETAAEPLVNHNVDVIRYFSDTLPEALADRRVTQQDFNQVIKRVNRIWNPFMERFEGKCNDDAARINLKWQESKI